MEELPQWFHKMGYTMKVEPTVDVLEKVEFCQTQPVFDGTHWRMVRNPRSCLSKDLVSTKSLNTKKAWQLQCQAISDCGLAAYGDMPVFGAFYNHLNVGGRHVQNIHRTNGLEYMSYGLHHKYEQPTWESRLSFFKAFNITPDEQTCLEKTYNQLECKYSPGSVVNFNNLTETVHLNI
jgi:hypothetical protein